MSMKITNDKYDKCNAKILKIKWLLKNFRFEWALTRKQLLIRHFLKLSRIIASNEANGLFDPFNSKLAEVI